MSKCRSCGAEIVWRLSEETGAMLPCNPTEVLMTEGDTRKLIDRRGKVITKASSYDLEFGPLLESHFSTCPQANKWRRKK